VTAIGSDSPEAAAQAPKILHPPHTRARSASVMVSIAALVLTGPVIFVAQNSGSTRVSFLALHDRAAVTAALLATAVAGWVFALVVSTARVLQWRRVERRLRSED
jgi:uncharacterized integral membrane protein